ncbi:MAG: DUF3667 domain-containing protein [Ferruginibacter sp.]
MTKVVLDFIVSLLGFTFDAMTITCKNCNEFFEGNFCPNCGQAAKVHRINALYFLHDIPHSVLHVDKGFPYTFLQLLVRPAKALQEYLAGKRARFDRPFSYVILMSAISAVVVTQVRMLIQKLSSPGNTSGMADHQSFFSHYQGVFIFLMIPLTGLVTWLLFRKNKYNFWEHILINTYLAAQLNVLLIIIAAFSLVKFFITGSADYSITIFVTGFMTYYAICFSGLMYPEVKGFTLGMKLGLMCFLLASLYITGMKVTGIIH